MRKGAGEKKHASIRGVEKKQGQDSALEGRRRRKEGHDDRTQSREVRGRPEATTSPEISAPLRHMWTWASTLGGGVV